MKKQSIQSLVIGFALGAAAILALGQSSTPSSQVGRYQIAGAGGDGNQTFVIIDTTTGAAKLLGGARGDVTLGVPFEQLKTSRH